MKSLRADTPPARDPTYIVNGSGGWARPLSSELPLYIGRDKAVFRNWEGRIFEIRTKRRIGRIR
jgi:lysine 2,3-aminomutase